MRVTEPMLRRGGGAEAGVPSLLIYGLGEHLSRRGCQV